MACSSYKDCNDHGNCIDNLCSCDLGWFGDSCTKSFQEEWSEEWSVFITIFTIANSLLLFLSVTKLYMIIKPETYLGFRRLSRRIISSPKNLSLCCIAIISLLKILWLLIDPLRFQEKASRFTDRMLYETVYPIYFCLYSTVVLVLAGLYQGIRREPTYQFKIMRFCFLLLMILGFLVTWTLGVLKGIRFNKQWAYSLGFSFMGFAAGLQGLSFIILLILICYAIQRKHTQSNAYIDSDADFTTARINPVAKDDLAMSTQYEAPKYILLISEEDRNVLKKIVILTTLTAVIGIVTILLSALFIDFEDSEGPEVMLVGMFLVFSLEAMGCLVIFMVFTTQVQVHSKENLKEFTKIAMKKRHVFSVIYDKENRFANIASRLENYFSK